MADNSNVYLRWEIGNATEKLADGEADSGGFIWTATVERRGDSTNDHMAEFTLRCESESNQLWKCEVEVHICALSTDAKWYYFSPKKVFSFDDDHSVWVTNSFDWGTLAHEHFIINDKVTLEFRIKSISSERKIYDQLVTARKRIELLEKSISDIMGEEMPRMEEDTSETIEMEKGRRSSKVAAISGGGEDPPAKKSIRS